VVRDLRVAFPRTAIEDSLVRDAAYAEVDADHAEGGKIAIMTPERALTLLTADPDELKDLGLILLDECHLMHPAKQGHEPLMRAAARIGQTVSAQLAKSDKMPSFD
jgi:hypothetical protein